MASVDRIIDAKPEVYNHNVETVPRLYRQVRRSGRYHWALEVINRVARQAPEMLRKSGLMVGLGETRDEIVEVLGDLRDAGCQAVTIGQYLQPTPKHHGVDRFVTPEEFASYEKAAYGKGFLMVSATPLTRSSYHAGDDFARLRAARQEKLQQA